MTQYSNFRLRYALAFVCLFLMAVGPVQAQRSPKQPPQDSISPPAPRMDYIGVLTSSADADDSQSACAPIIHLFKGRGPAPGKKSKCDRAIDLLAGPADPVPVMKLAKPRTVTTDSEQRVIVSDPGAHAVHIFDLDRHKYVRIAGGPSTRLSGKATRLRTPSGVAVDSQDNIYISDIKQGMIVVYDSRGKFLRYIGKIHDEGSYDRPTAIAIDRNTDRLYVVDTPRNLVLIQDASGKLLRAIGKRGGGSAPGEFLYPTDVAVAGGELIVADAKNSRLQFFDLDGNFRSQVPIAVTAAGKRNPEVSLAVDSQDNIYVTNTALDSVRVYNHQGQLLGAFGQLGRKQGEFNTPAGVWVDSHNRIYVADADNHRVQMFQLGNLQPDNTVAAPRPQQSVRQGPSSPEL